ncbi:MAG: cyclic nucleotide-binding domain-containing protein [Planctomycetes bacterium]|nr:cyclic nucleotide-binding domain-containing protein [Planctomycetota bacterium]
MQRIRATVVNHEHCPLYQNGDALLFSPPSVQGVGGLSVCASAAGLLSRAASKIQGGASPDAYERTFCGGCTGRAWFRLEPEPAPAGSETPALGGISRLSIFSGVPQIQLLQIAPLLHERTVAPAEEIIRRGDPPVALYAIASGECDVVAHDEEKGEVTLTTLRAGDCFGEVSLLTGETATATIRARTPCVLLVLAKEDFPTALAQVPSMAISLARVLAARVKRANTWVVDEMKRGILGKLEIIRPAELVQAVNVNSMTGMLLVQNAGKSVTIYFQDGQVFEVQSDSGQAEEEAFYDFLTWARGNFRFEPVRKETTVRRLRSDTMGLLLEGMRRLDEHRKTEIRVKDPAPQ